MIMKKYHLLVESSNPEYLTWIKEEAWKVWELAQAMQQPRCMICGYMIQPNEDIMNTDVPGRDVHRICVESKGGL